MKYTFENNPDPAIAVPVANPNTGQVWLPQRTKPEEICINKLKNWSDDPALDAGGLAVAISKMLVLNDDCQVGPQAWPCISNTVIWDLNNDVSPPAVNCTACDGLTPDSVVFARETSQNEISHVCLAGTWVKIGLSTVTGGTGPTPGTPVDEVCYDTAAWTFPATYSQITGGYWNVYGADRMDPFDACATAGTVTQCLVGNVEIADIGDNGAFAHPPNGENWGQQAWAVKEAADCNTAIAHVNFVPTSKPAFRVDLGITATTVSQVDVSFVIPPKPGAAWGGMSWAIYDIISEQHIPISIIQQPAGAPLVVNSTNLGPRVAGNNPPAGSYTIRGTIPGTVTPSNLRMVCYNWGNGVVEERIENIQIQYQSPGAACCHDWQSVGALAGWMTSRDPNGAIWFVDGSKVCTNVTPGVGGNYAGLSGCDAPNAIAPSVTAGTITGGTTASAACSVVGPGGLTGTQTGIYIDSCSLLTLTGGQTPNVTHPPNTFPLYWRQAFKLANNSVTTLTRLENAGGGAIWG